MLAPPAFRFFFFSFFLSIFFAFFGAWQFLVWQYCLLGKTVWYPCRGNSSIGQTYNAYAYKTQLFAARIALHTHTHRQSDTNTYIHCCEKRCEKEGKSRNSVCACDEHERGREFAVRISRAFTTHTHTATHDHLCMNVGPNSYSTEHTNTHSHVRFVYERVKELTVISYRVVIIPQCFGPVAFWTRNFGINLISNEIEHN